MPLEDGKPQTNSFTGLIQERRTLERSHVLNSRKSDCLVNRIDTDYGMVTPSKKDVLLGQGRRFRSHMGNIALDKMIEEKQKEYEDATTRFEKTCIVKGIVLKIKETGSRFLRADDDKSEWNVVEDIVAHESISMRFRNRSRIRRNSRSLQHEPRPELVDSRHQPIPVHEQSGRLNFIPGVKTLVQQQLQYWQLQQNRKNQQLQQLRQQQLLNELQNQLIVGQRQQLQQQLILDQMQQQLRELEL